ncbi:MAG: hypothetical protein FJZ01_06325 [Candidatus Sericytochromatia bacterium]|nr:hypothetical protein [Candidatus Tanganyikabacteria bacterium]
MRNAPSRERGFTLALSLFVSVVVMMLAGGLIARILTDMKGAKTSALVASLSNDADIGLNLAEVEIFRDLDVLAGAIWTIGTNDVLVQLDQKKIVACPEVVQATSNAACVPGDVYINQVGTTSYGADPLRNLDLISNARNWPPFGNWTHYLAPTSAYGGGYKTADGVGWTATAPSTKWSGSDQTLTNGWWYVPRESNVADVYYYGRNANNTSDKDFVFPMVIAGEKPNNPKTAQYMGDTNVTGVVTQNFWYTQVLPINSVASTDYEIPATSVWPNADSEYAGADDKVTTTPRYVWNTPFYKKMYRLPDGRKVAVYVRLDLRDYFPPVTSTGTESWEQPAAAELGYNANKSKFNFLKFFVAAVPEGRIERIPGTTTLKYRPAEMRTKYILVKTLGAWNRSMAVADLATYTFPQKDDRQFPAVLGTANGVLRQGTDIRGQVFRADGNRGFNWESINPMSKVIRPPGSPTTTWTPIASERYVYLYEQVPTRDAYFSNRAATATFLIWASYSIPAVDQQTKGRKISSTGWTFHRIDIDRLLATSGVPAPQNTYFDPRRANANELYFGPDQNWDYPCYDVGSFQVGVYECTGKQDHDASTSFESSFSALVDASGSFVISAASGWPGETNLVDPRYRVPLRWRGPMVDPTTDPLGNPATASRIYFTTNVPISGQYIHRRSFRYDSTESVSGMR